MGCSWRKPLCLAAPAKAPLRQEPGSGWLATEGGYRGLQSLRPMSML
jgi:hypothetical protein